MPTVIGMKNGKVSSLFMRVCSADPRRTDMPYIQPLAKFIGVIPEKKVFEFVQMLSSE